jgi:hypothetical protein
MDQAPKDQSQVRRVGRPRKLSPQEIQTGFAERLKSDEADRAQALASRIWQGQSPDTLTRGERLERIRNALQAQGLSMDGVKL